MEKKSWPSWRYGPNGQADVFSSPEEVPNGWVDHPSLVAEAKAPKPPAAPVVAKSDEGTNNAVLDAAGWPFDPELHAATASKTQAGLWRMKVGVPRPDPKPGFPKPVLDL